VQGQGIDLGGATLRLYGDRTALDRELAILQRYTDKLERQGIKVKFDADTGRATREVDNLARGMNDLNRLLGDLGKAAHGDFSALAAGLGQAGGAAAGATGAIGGAQGAMAGLVGGAMKAIPVLGQLGMAAMGVKAIFQGLGAAIGAALAPLEKFSHEADRFNQQVAKGGVFAARSYAITSPEGDLVEKTSSQMRALRPVISREFQEIHREVAKISGATASEIQEGFNIILQNVGNLGTAGEDLSNVTQLATRTAAAMNTLGIPARQLRSEVMSLMTGNIQVYDELGKSLGYTSEKVKELQAQGGTVFYDDLIAQLETLYEGQKVMAESLSNVKSNYQEFFETVGAQGGQRLEAGLGGALNTVMSQLASLEKSWITMFDTIGTAMEPVLRFLGQIGAMFVPIGSAIGSVFSTIFAGLGPILNLLNAMLAPALELVLGALNFMAKLLEVGADRFNRLMKPVNAFFAVFADGDTNLIRDFFGTLGDQIKKATEWADGLIDRFTALIRKFVEFRANRQASSATVMDPKTGQLRRLTSDERQEFVAERLANYDRRTDFDAGFGYKSKMLDQESKAFFEELSNKNQGWAGRDGSVSHRDLVRAQEIAEVRKRMHENDIKGLEQSLRLMTAQKSLAQAMSELTENRRRLDTARAGFAVQVAGSPEVRANAEIAQRELLARQEADRLQERRQVLAVERQIQERQAEIQVRQAQMQTTQMEILQLEATISRDKAVAAIKAQEDLLPKLNRAEKIIAEGRIRDARVELTHREAILAQASRAVGLARDNEGVVGAIAGIEQQRLSVQEQQLDVLAQQNRLTAEQARLLDSITEREQALRREYEQVALDAARAKADQEDRIKGFEREATELGEQIKLQKVLADQAKVRADQEVDAASRALSIARAREAADAPGSGIREIIGAEVQALAAGEAGLTSVADATKRLYDARERQLLQEQELARTQQRLQQEREQSEMRIADLRLRVQQFEIAAQIAQEKVRIKQAQVQVERDNLSNSLQVSVNAAGGSGDAVGGMATFGRTGSLDLDPGYGMVDIRGSDRAAVIADARDAIRANTARGQKTWIGGDRSGDVDATNLQGADLDRVIDQGISRHQNRVRPGEFAIDLIAKEGTPLGIPLSNVGNLGGGNGWGGDTPRGNLAIHLGPNSRSGNAPAAPVLPPPPGATQPAAPRPAAAAPVANGPNTWEGVMAMASQAGAKFPELVAAQWALESGWGQKPSGQNNMFGLKGKGAGTSKTTQEFENGQWKTISDTFLNFGSVAEGVQYLVKRWYQDFGSYQGVNRAGTREDAARMLSSQGYATDPQYSGKLIDLMQKGPAAPAAASPAVPANTAAGELPVTPFVPATTGQQQLEGATQRVEILEQALGALTETIKQFETLLSNLTQRQGIEAQTLALQQQGAIGNFRMERTEAMVIQRALGSQQAKFYADVADTYGGWMSGAIKGALQKIRQTGELDLAEFAQSIMGGLMDRMIELATDFVMAPVEQAMKKALFSSLSGINDEKLAEMVRQEQASQGQLDAATRMGAAVDRFGAAVDSMATGTPDPASGSGPIAQGQEAARLPVETLPGTTGSYPAWTYPFSKGGEGGGSSVLAGLMDGSNPADFFDAAGATYDIGLDGKFEQLDGAFDGILGGATNLGTVFQDGAQQSGQNLSGLQGAFGTALSGLVSLGMVFGGIQQIRKGGTGNVISGIGGILGGIGTALMGPLGGMFGGAAAAPAAAPALGAIARAGGGQANKGDRLLVGEFGPELLDVPENGAVRSNAELRSLMQGGSRDSQPGLRLDMRFESTRFMDREWVDREQLEAAVARAERNGAMEGERRGANRALDRIKHSPAVRRDLGLPRG